MPDDRVVSRFKMLTYYCTEDRIRLVSLGLMSLPTLVEHLNFHKIRREIPLLFSGILKQMNGSQEEFRWKEMLIIFEHY
jgi:hypothetical protein